MADQLAVWLYETLVAVISRRRGRLRLEYSDEAFGSNELGSPVLSVSLPLTKVTYTHIPVRAFIDGLLPEGQSRDAIARDVRVDRDDSYGLIEALGRDCAGAIVIQPLEEPAPPEPTTSTARALADADIADLVANLRVAPLGAGGRVRISLARIQEKLLLVRMPDGRWGQPIDGTPSTHILKPQSATYPATVPNEAFCMRAARHLGLDVASVETTDVDGRGVIIVERYDRIVDADGKVQRVHQEDFCQARSVLPNQKYEEDGGPSLKRIAEVIQAFATAASLDALLRAVTLNLVLGNGDAHAKNFSLLHEPSGAIRLAPLYDLMCTLFYGEERVAMYIDNVRLLNRVTGSRLLNEAARWGMPRARATEIIGDLLDRVPSAVSTAASETAGLPSEIPQMVANQRRMIASDFERF